MPSKISITVKKNGTYDARSQTTRFVAYQAIPDGWTPGTVFPPRIAAVTTTYIADGSDETTSVGVTVDDVSGPNVRRVSAFSDPGDSGNVDAQFFVTTTHACCVMPALHYVRFLETGKLLFRSSGDSEFGASAWAEIPRVYPNIKRWAAFEAAGLFDKEEDQKILGYLTYGDLKGERSRIVIRLNALPTEAARENLRSLRDDAAHCGFVLWSMSNPEVKHIDRPAVGECGYPLGEHGSTLLWPLARQGVDPVLSGFALEFSVLGRVYATIPIINDRFDLSQAHTDTNVKLEIIQASATQPRPVQP